MIEEFRGAAHTTFHGLPVFHFAFSHTRHIGPGDIPDDVESRAWRVGSVRHDDADGEVMFPVFLDAVDTTRVRALMLGAYSAEEAGTYVASFQEALREAADRFPALEALFIADLPRSFSEISWIEQHDPGHLLAVFPRLKVLGMRGTSGLAMKPLDHEHLEELVIQSGGMSPHLVQMIGRSTLPALTSLELYLGASEYDGGATVEDLAPILDGTAFPHLRHLGLRDAENADAVAAALAHAPVVAGLETLDLSLGTLGDEGAAALLAGQGLTHLKRLDLHHHYMSDAMIERLREALPDVEVEVSERKAVGGAGDDMEEEDEGFEDFEDFEDPEDSMSGFSGRYVAVSE